LLNTLLLSLLPVLVSGCTAPNDIQPSQLKSFNSDGCSWFPDGTPEQPRKWCHCCYAHDIRYWKGGTREQRKLADLELRQCVQVVDNRLAKSMYGGVRAFGGPFFPTSYRWGFGWPYLRGYKTRSEQENISIENKWKAYLQSGSTPFCKQ